MAESSKQSSPPSQAADLLDMDQAIEALKTTRPTFYRWLRDGKIKGMKVGRQWRFYRAEIDRFLKGEAPQIELTADIEPLIKSLQERLASLKRSVNGTGRSDRVALAIEEILRLAAAMRATDAHVMYAGNRDKAHLRLRVDGVLHEITSFDLRLLSPLVGKLKLMVGCDPQQKQRPMDGVYATTCDGKTIKARLAFIPTVGGDSVTLRLLEQQWNFELDKMGYSPRDLELLKRAMGLPWGLIVVTGPAGCGKTTLLYSCLEHLSNPELKIMTAEDPVELEIPGVVQSQLNVAAGVTHATLLRSILRSDPDVVMIGEIRDQETAKLVLTTALTGHLALTTLHTDDAASAIVRMREVSENAMMVGDAMKLVVAQRLIRKLCPKCAVKRDGDEQVLEESLVRARSEGLDTSGIAKDFLSAAGCRECGFTGYRGRMVMAEVLQVTPAIASAIKTGKGAEQIRQIAAGDGMSRMFADGVRRASEGLTTVEEVLRVAPRLE